MPSPVVTSDINPIVAEINRRKSLYNRPFVVALDGRSGTGKSTVANKLAQQLGAVVIDGDDFYRNINFDDWVNLSPRDQALGCIDWARLKKQALQPLLTGKSAMWHPFDWDAMQGVTDQVQTRQPSDVIIVDGTYSTGAGLADSVDFSILLTVPHQKRMARLAAREGEHIFTDPWHQAWEKAEDYYFTNMRPQSAFDIVYKQM